MKVYGDYHTHTHYSDGVAKVEQNVAVAIEKGLQELAITDHAFGNPSTWSLTREKFASQLVEINAMREKFGDKLTIYTGIEADIVGTDGELDIRQDEVHQFDVLVMGYHSFAKPKDWQSFKDIFLSAHLRMIKFPSKEDIARNTKSIIESIKRYPIDILAHPNHLFKVDCYELAKAASDYGVYMELNAKHINTLSHEAFEKMLTTDVKFLINSDAHKAERIANFEKPLAYAKKHNMDLSRIVNLHSTPTFKKKS
ncbi:MAG: PHP domain-containing protein [Bacillota bacterium]